MSMNLERRPRTKRLTKRRIREKHSDFSEVLRLFDEIRSSFVIARYFISLNKRPDIVSSSITEACEKFDTIKSLLTSFNGFTRDESLMHKIDVLEKEITLLKKIA